MVTDMQQVPTLDYSALDADTLVLVQELDTEWDFVLKRTAKDLGAIVLKAKKRLPHGLYLSWIASKGMSQPTAWRCMQAAQGKEVKSFKMNDLDIEVIEQPVERDEGSGRVGNSPSLEERRKTVENFITDNPNWQELSYRAIARMCGVDHKTVTTIIKDLFPEPEPEGTQVVDADPETPPIEEQEPFQEEIYKTDEFSQVLDAPSYEESQLPSEELEAPPKMNKPSPVKSATLTALQSSESNEWYTPVEYVNAARKLMGGKIELDPASCEAANRIVKAERIYTKRDKGLEQTWKSQSLWLNPPYGVENGRSNQELWTQQLIERYKAGLVAEAVLLVNAVTEAKWFQPLYDYLICLTDHRIRFYTTDGESNQPTQGNAFIYFPKRGVLGFRDVQREKRFIELFSSFGTVVERAKR